MQDTNNGVYLASIHSMHQNQNVMDTCLSYCDMQPKLCWIGLEITVNNSTDITMKWIDGTDIDSSLIDQLWCDGYPFNDSYINVVNEYFVYVDATENCWKFTTNSSLIICGVQGPKMFANTG